MFGHTWHQMLKAEGAEGALIPMLVGETEHRRREGIINLKGTGGRLSGYKGCCWTGTWCLKDSGKGDVSDPGGKVQGLLTGERADLM